MFKGNWTFKLTNALATVLIAVGFGIGIYIFVIQTKYLQPSYLIPHPESGRIVPYEFKGIVRYLTPDEEMMFHYGFYVGMGLATLGAVWKQTLEKRSKG